MTTAVHKPLINTATRLVEWVGRSVMSRIGAFGATVLYVQTIGIQALLPPFRVSQTFQQLEFIGNKSVGIIGLTSFFTGAVFGLQIGGIFEIFDAESIMGAATGIALAREMAPLMTGFLIAGRAGSAMTAEIATMKVNEQIDAMEAMSVEPVHYLVVPRVVAALLIVPFLTGIFIFVGLVGAFIVGLALFEVDTAIFLERLANYAEIDDIISGLEKSFVFAFIIAATACRYGLAAKGGAKGVGQATTDSVVMTYLLILISDLVLTYIQVVY